MIGVHETVSQQFSDGELVRLLSNAFDQRGIYERQPGDRTGALPLRHHLRQVAKGWQLVEVVDVDGVKRALSQNQG